MSAGPFSRKRGSLEMRLGEAEAEILGQVIGEMRDQLSLPDRPLHLWRLFPPAYRDDAEAQEEFARFTTDDLVRQRIVALETVDSALRRGRVRRGIWVTALEDDEVTALMGALNDARLALGTRLAVTDESEESEHEYAEDDPAGLRQVVYRYLGWLQSFLVDELLDGM